VHILEADGTRLVIRVPATGWGAGMTPAAERALRSQAATMRLIRQQTTVPVPEIYDLDTTVNNKIGAPYICMSFVPGRPVSRVWFDDSVSRPREELRRSILASVARAMAQFSRLHGFDRIGSVMEAEEGSISIGPVYEWREDDDGSVVIEASGPFDSASAYLQARSRVEPRPKDTLWSRAEAKVMDVLKDCLASLDSPEGFVLCPPDFDSQNIMVDEHGHVTGIIDWDLAQTMPRRAGYARYLSWITRDWDPLMYGWPARADSEDSPAALERYRAYYNAELGKALRWRQDWRFTEMSHVVEAVWNAVMSPLSRREICRKFVQVAVGEDVDALDVMYDIGEGRYSNEAWGNLKARLMQLLPDGN
jgi:aminoglycoside phosphotransferase (APT) family kinase protein